MTIRPLCVHFLLLHENCFADVGEYLINTLATPFSYFMTKVVIKIFLLFLEDAILCFPREQISKLSFLIVGHLLVLKVSIKFLT